MSDSRKIKYLHSRARITVLMEFQMIIDALHMQINIGRYSFLHTYSNDFINKLCFWTFKFWFRTMKAKSILNWILLNFKIPLRPIFLVINAGRSNGKFNLLELGLIECWNLTYTTRQGSRVRCLAQTGFSAFGKGGHSSSVGPPMLKPNNFSDYLNLYF